MKLYNFAFLILIFFPFSENENLTGKNKIIPEAFHKYYVGKCLIDYNQQEKALQVSQFMFLDDLEAALGAQGAHKLFLCTEREDEKAEIHLEKYLNQHLKFEVNGSERSYVFIGKESSEDYMGVWCYVEITDIPKLEKIYFKNDLLMDIYDDQKNVIIFKGPNNKEASFLFQKGKAEQTLEFN